MLQRYPKKNLYPSPKHCPEKIHVPNNITNNNDDNKNIAGFSNRS